MMAWLSLAAALGCALCNGVAAVLQKAGVDEAPEATSLRIGFLVRLARNWRYSLGVALDLVGGVLILVAVHRQPLFLVQSIIGASIVVTFLVERLVLHRYAGRSGFAAIGMVVVGLALLAVTAVPEQAQAVSNIERWVVIGALVPILLAGAMCSKSKASASATGLAILSGIAFGGTAVTGRMLSFAPPFWHVLGNPTLYAFAAYGVTGILLFSIGLQRATATVLSTVMVTAETLAPAIVGVLLLGDRVHHGWWPIAVLGVALSCGGAVIIARVRAHAIELDYS